MYITMGHHMAGWPLPAFLTHNHLALTLTQMLLALIVMIINGKFFTSGFRSLAHGAPNMDTLVALGSSVSFGWSLFVFYRMCGMITGGAGNMELMDLYHGQLYFESAAMIPALRRRRQRCCSGTAQKPKCRLRRFGQGICLQCVREKASLWMASWFPERAL